MTAAIAQQGRFVFPGDDPVGDRARYVVTVTNRSRDLNALARLSPAVAERVTVSVRLIHLAGPVDRVSERRVRDWAADIRAGVGRPWHWFELTGFDPLQPTTASGGRARAIRAGRARQPPRARPLLLSLAAELHKRGHRPTPVVRVGPMSERLRNLMVTVRHGAANGLGLAVDLGAGGGSIGDLRAVVDRLRLDPAQTDLLLDAPADRGQRLSPAELADTVGRVRALAGWRNLVLLSSGVPSIIPRPEAAGDGGDPALIVVERPDWPAYRELQRLLAEAGGDDDPGGEPGAAGPTFGDYGIRHPLRLAWPGTKRANLRYTAGEVSLVAMGEATRNGLAPGDRYAELSRLLVADPRFRGADHCWGCSRIEAAAHGPADEVPRLQSAWDTVGLVHHITDVVSLF